MALPTKFVVPTQGDPVRAKFAPTPPAKPAHLNAGKLNSKGQPAPKAPPKPANKRTP